MSHTNDTPGKKEDDELIERIDAMLDLKRTDEVAKIETPQTNEEPLDIFKDVPTIHIQTPTAPEVVVSSEVVNATTEDIDSSLPAIKLNLPQEEIPNEAAQSDNITIDDAATDKAVDEIIDAETDSPLSTDDSKQ